MTTLLYSLCIYTTYIWRTRVYNSCICAIWINLFCVSSPSSQSSAAECTFLIIICALQDILHRRWIRQEKKTHLKRAHVQLFRKNENITWTRTSLTLRREKKQICKRCVCVKTKINVKYDMLIFSKEQAIVPTYIYIRKVHQFIIKFVFEENARVIYGWTRVPYLLARVLFIKWAEVIISNNKNASNKIVLIRYWY